MQVRGTAIDAIRARAMGDDYFVRPPGNPALVTLGLGNAVFLGGVVLVSHDGSATALVPPRRVWTWPALLLATNAALCIGLVFALASQGWVMWFVVGLLTTVLGGMAVVAYLVALRLVKKRLVVDARSGCCVELDGSRVVLSVPASLMRCSRVQLYADPGYADRYDVLINLGLAELWVHQDSEETTAVQLATTVAQQLGIPFDAERERKASG